MSSSTLQLSARETEVLALAWQCFESEPKIDLDKFATLTGYTRGSAQVTLGNIKRKLKNHSTSSPSAATPRKAGKKATSTTSTPASTTKGKKRAAADPNNHNNDGDESPTKKSRAAGKAAKAKKMSKLEDEDDEFAQVKIKKEEVRGVENDFEAFLAREGRVGRVEEGSFQAVMEELQAEREGEGEEYEV